MITAKDGLPARPSGAWAREKLFYVGRYQDIFAKGMKNRFDRRVYVDLLAGPGICVDEQGEYEGSALLSRRHLFTDWLFVEADPTNAAALRTRMQLDESEVIDADANAAIVIDTLRMNIPSGALTLVFVDNLALDTVRFETLHALTLGKKIDLLITVMVGDLVRNLSQALARRAGHDIRFDACFGSDAWRGVAERAKARNRSDTDTVTELLEFYETCFRGIGYTDFAGAKAPMKNSRNVGLYRLFLASRSPKAVEFFRKIEAFDYWGQRGLF